jgi:hypothetical protein
VGEGDRSQSGPKPPDGAAAPQEEGQAQPSQARPLAPGEGAEEQAAATIAAVVEASAAGASTDPASGPDLAASIPGGGPAPQVTTPEVAGAVVEEEAGDEVPEEELTEEQLAQEELLRQQLRELDQRPRTFFAAHPLLAGIFLVVLVAVGLALAGLLRHYLAPAAGPP